MKYSLLKEVISLLENFELHSETSGKKKDLNEFKKWIVQDFHDNDIVNDITYDGKENGRSLESVISTHLVHLSRYAKSYSKIIIQNSDFKTQDDFIYLITLKTFGKISKMDLIKKNVHDKSNGIQIINRLIRQDFILQESDVTDKRSKLISITDKGLNALENIMQDIRNATNVVSGDLSKSEKIQLIKLLDKLNNFHLDIYNKNQASENFIKNFTNNID